MKNDISVKRVVIKKLFNFKLICVCNFKLVKFVIRLS